MALSSVFNETYENYLSQLSALELSERHEILKIAIEGDHAMIPFYNTAFNVSSGGIFDMAGKTPNLSICVVLCKYLLMCPDEIPQGTDLAAFKDFKDAAPLIHFFANAVQGEVVRSFAGNVASLEEACVKLGGHVYERELGYQIKYRFMGLPQVPLYLLFNDAQEGFAAQCHLLFERRVAAFLDMESVAMLGGALSKLLKSVLKPI